MVKNSHLDDELELDELLENHLAKKTDFLAQNTVFAVRMVLLNGHLLGDKLYGKRIYQLVFLARLVILPIVKEEALRQAYDHLETKVELRTQDLLAI